MAGVIQIGHRPKNLLVVGLNPVGSQDDIFSSSFLPNFSSRESNLAGALTGQLSFCTRLGLELNSSWKHGRFQTLGPGTWALNQVFQRGASMIMIWNVKQNNPSWVAWGETGLISTEWLKVSYLELVQLWRKLLPHPVHHLLQGWAEIAFEDSSLHLWDRFNDSYYFFCEEKFKRRDKVTTQ